MPLLNSPDLLSLPKQVLFVIFEQCSEAELANFSLQSKEAAKKVYEYNQEKYRKKFKDHFPDLYRALGEEEKKHIKWPEKFQEEIERLQYRNLDKWDKGLFSELVLFAKGGNHKDFMKTITHTESYIGVCLRFFEMYDEDGRTLLSWVQNTPEILNFVALAAIKHNRSKLLRDCFKLGNINLTTHDEYFHNLWGALCWAACNYPDKDFSIIDILLENATPELMKQPNRDSDPFLFAIFKLGKLALIKHIIERDDFDFTLMNEAGETFLDLLFDNRYNPYHDRSFYNFHPSPLCDFSLLDMLYKKAPHLMHVRSKKRGSTPLFDAMQCNHLGLIKYMLEKGGVTPADEDREGDKSGNTLLHNAILFCVYDRKYSDYMPMIELLMIKAPHLLNKPNSKGQTPLLLAIECGHQRLVDYLLKQPTIDLAVVDLQGRTVLDVVANIWDKAKRPIILDSLVRNVQGEFAEAINILYRTDCKIGIDVENKLWQMNFTNPQKAQLFCNDLNKYYQYLQPAEAARSFVLVKNENGWRIDIPIEQCWAILPKIKDDLRGRLNESLRQLDPQTAKTVRDLIANKEGTSTEKIARTKKINNLLKKSTLTPQAKKELAFLVTGIALVAALGIIAGPVVAAAMGTALIHYRVSKLFSDRDGKRNEPEVKLNKPGESRTGRGPSQGKK